MASSSIGAIFAGLCQYACLYHLTSYILFSHLFLTLKSEKIFLRIDSWPEPSLYQLVEVVINFIKAISKIYRIIRRLTMLVLTCVKDVGVLRIQPYKLAPKGVPRHGTPAPEPLLRSPETVQIP